FPDPKGSSLLSMHRTCPPWHSNSREVEHSRHIRSIGMLLPLQGPTYEIYMNREDCEPSILYGVLSLLKTTTHRPFERMARPLGGGGQMDHTVSGNHLLASPPKRGHYFVVAPNLDGRCHVNFGVGDCAGYRHDDRA